MGDGVALSRGPEPFIRAVEWMGVALEALGVLAIVLGALAATLLFLRRWAREGWTERGYEQYRSNLGRGILVGLELLVGADIIDTVAVKPSLQSVLALALVVAIRTFLSFSLEVEINGRWPWQAPREKTTPAAETGQSA